MKKKTRSESSEQQAVISWFRLQYKHYRLIGIPNGQWIAGTGARKFALINKYKAEGLYPGVSDLFLCVPRGRLSGMWIEMKKKGATVSSLSEQQKSWLNTMEIAGYAMGVGYGFEDARKKIEDYLNGY